MSLGETLEKCQSKQGTWFDPTLVDTLANIIRLAEMGLMCLPERPTQLPAIWLEEATKRGQ